MGFLSTVRSSFGVQGSLECSNKQQIGDYSSNVTLSLNYSLFNIILSIQFEKFTRHVTP